MKILLVNPSDRYDVYGGLYSPQYPPPLGIAYIGTVLERAGHEVAIIDMDNDGISEQDFVTMIICSQYQVVGFTATTPVFKNAEKLCRLVKDNSSAVTVVGGIHATLVPEECLKSRYIDFVVRGEAEITILELMKAVSGTKSYSEVRGISFRQDGRIVSTPERELISNIDSIPFLDRNLFRRKKYYYPGLLYLPSMPMITSRGCLHNCTYCCVKKIFGRKFRYRSAANVADEIDDLVEVYGIKHIDIWDDSFSADRNRVFELGDEINRRGLKIHFAFPNGLRADEVDEDLLRCLKGMGAYNIAFGIESGNQATLDKAKKGIRLEQIETAYNSAKKMDFETWGFFMLGLPGETEETLKDTLNFAKRIDPDIVKFNIFTPYPKTEAFEQLSREGLITDFDYSKYSVHSRPVHRLPGLSEDVLAKWQTKMYRDFYLKPNKVLKSLLKIRSFKRAKMNIQFVFSFYKYLRKN